MDCINALPSSTSHCTPGICLMAPIAITIADIPAITIANDAIAVNAAGIGTNCKTASAAEVATRTIDKDIADSKAALESIDANLPITAPTMPMTTVITAIFATAFKEKPGSAFIVFDNVNNVPITAANATTPLVN